MPLVQNAIHSHVAGLDERSAREAVQARLQARAAVHADEQAGGAPVRSPAQLSRTPSELDRASTAPKSTYPGFVEQRAHIREAAQAQLRRRLEMEPEAADGADQSLSSSAQQPPLGRHASPTARRLGEQELADTATLTPGQAEATRAATRAQAARHACGSRSQAERSTCVGSGRRHVRKRANARSRGGNHERPSDCDRGGHGVARAGCTCTPLCTAPRRKPRAAAARVPILARARRTRSTRRQL